MKNTTLAIVGVGYVGINLAVRFPQFFKTLAYDIDKNKINSLNRGIDPSGQFSNEDILECGCIFTSDPDELTKANYYLITVPTPLDNNNRPDQGKVYTAIRDIEKYLDPGDTVIIESTVLPGTTNSIRSTLNREDINLAFSPERVSPNDHSIKFEDIVKVVSCVSESKLKDLEEIYSKVFNKVEVSKDIEACEFSKLLENTSRDINIAMMNEFYEGALRKGIDFKESLRLARTKWNFPKIDKGLVGGHCISVDPLYLASYLDVKAESIIVKARQVNDSMVNSLAERIISISAQDDKILLLGQTYKRNCNDTRNSKAVELYKLLCESRRRNIDAYDPFIDRNKDLSEFEKYDLIVTLVAHDEFMQLNKEQWSAILKSNGAIFDFAQIIPEQLEKRFKVYY